MRELEAHDDSLGLTVADTLLARDRLRAEMKSGSKKVEKMMQRGLKKEDLTFCD